MPFFYQCISEACIFVNQNLLNFSLKPVFATMLYSVKGRLWAMAICIFFAIGWVGCSDQSQTESAQFFLKGNLKLETKEYAEAIRYYDEALLKQSDMADAFCNRGIAYVHIGEIDKALEDFNKAIELDKKLDEAYFNRAGALVDRKEFALAASDLEHIRKNYQDSTNYYLRWGDLKFNQGYYDQALAEYDRALELKASNVQALVNRGVAYFEKKDFNAAQSDFEKALKLDAQQQLAYNNLALISARQNQLDQAAKFVERALDFDPVNPIYLNNKGYILLLQKKNEEAKKLIERALEKEPQNSYAHRNLGMYWMQNGNKVEALNELKKAYDLNPATDQIHFWLGKAQSDNNQKEEACRTWKKGETIGDNDAAAERKKNCQ